MSIYKDNPELSVDFEIQPFALAFSLVVEKIKKQINRIQTDHVDSFSAVQILFSEFDTVEKRLFRSEVR